MGRGKVASYSILKTRDYFWACPFGPGCFGVAVRSVLALLAPSPTHPSRKIAYTNKKLPSLTKEGQTLPKGEVGVVVFSWWVRVI